MLSRSKSQSQVPSLKPWHVSKQNVHRRWGKCKWGKDGRRVLELHVMFNLQRLQNPGTGRRHPGCDGKAFTDTFAAKQQDAALFNVATRKPKLLPVPLLLPCYQGGANPGPRLRQHLKQSSRTSMQVALQWGTAARGWACSGLLLLAHPPVVEDFGAFPLCQTHAHVEQ